MTDSDIRETLRDVIDPELGVNIVDLGLVYGIEVDGADVRLVMTMTNPACPLLQYLKDRVSSAVRARYPDVAAITFDIVWDPRWDPGMMSDAARRQLDGR